MKPETKEDRKMLKSALLEELKEEVIDAEKEFGKRAVRFAVRTLYKYPSFSRIRKSFKRIRKLGK